jgi:hypothetical protein
LCTNWLVLNYDAHAFFQLPSRDILFEETHDIFPFVVGNKLSTFFTGLPRFHSNAARDGFALNGWELREATISLYTFWPKVFLSFSVLQESSA